MMKEDTLISQDEYVKVQPSLRARRSNYTGTNSTGFSPARHNCAHANVTSQTITYSNPNANQKNNTKCRPRILNPNVKPANIRKGRLFAGLALGLRILD